MTAEKKETVVLRVAEIRCCDTCRHCYASPYEIRDALERGSLPRRQACPFTQNVWQFGVCDKYESIEVPWGGMAVTKPTEPTEGTGT